MYNKKVDVRVDEETYNMLSAISEAHDSSKSKIIRKLIRKEFMKDPIKNEFYKQYSRQ